MTRAVAERALMPAELQVVELDRRGTSEERHLHLDLALDVFDECFLLMVEGVVVDNDNIINIKEDDESLSNEDARTFLNLL
jgi:hypothetical protein